MTDANGNVLTETDQDGNKLPSPIFPVFLDGLSTTLTITGLNDHLITPNLIFTVALGSVNDGIQSTTANEVTGLITNANTSTGVMLSTSSPVFTQGNGTNTGQLTVTATLLQTYTQNIYVNLAFTGTAIANENYTISNQQNPSNPLQILVPAGSLSGSLVLQGATAGNLTQLSAGWDTVTVSIVSATNAVPVNTQSVTAFLVNPNVPVVLSATDSTVAEGGVAAVNVELNEALPFPVSVQYNTVDGSAIAGTSYTKQTGTLNFAAGQTSKTIYIQTQDGVRVQRRRRRISLSISRTPRSRSTGIRLRRTQCRL